MFKDQIGEILSQESIDEATIVVKVRHFPSCRVVWYVKVRDVWYARRLYKWRVDSAPHFGVFERYKGRTMTLRGHVRDYHIS